MYSNVFRCTLLCGWSTCTPHVHVLRVYSSGTLTVLCVVLLRVLWGGWGYGDGGVAVPDSVVYCTLGVL